MLSRTCEYALRALTYIARHGQDRPVLAREIAAPTRAPLTYLQKILNGLVRSGILSSTRGIGGGFQLCKPPDQVRLADVLAPFEEVRRSNACPFDDGNCDGCEPCPIHERWASAVKPFEAFLETTTLADLLKKN